MLYRYGSVLLARSVSKFKHTNKTKGDEVTTIKLIPGEIEFNVSIDSASMPSLFNQSLETTIHDEVARQVTGRVPSNTELVSQVAEYMQDDASFARKISDWVYDTIDTRDIARIMSEDFDFSQITEYLGIESDGFLTDERFLRAITNYSRFRSIVTNAVGELYESNSMEDFIKEKIESMSTNIANEVAEKVMLMISNRLNRNADV
jgi:hypothetical protein